MRNQRCTHYTASCNITDKLRLKNIKFKIRITVNEFETNKQLTFLQEDVLSYSNVKWSQKKKFLVSNYNMSQIMCTSFCVRLIFVINGE